MKLSEITHATARPELLASGERLEGNVAGPLKFADCQMSVGQYHHGEEVTADECCVIDRFETETSMLGGLRRTL